MSDVNPRKASLAAADMSLTRRPPRNAVVLSLPLSSGDEEAAMMLQKATETAENNYIEVVSTLSCQLAQEQAHVYMRRHLFHLGFLPISFILRRWKTSSQRTDAAHVADFWGLSVIDKSDKPSDGPQRKLFFTSFFSLN
jgi:hypothetical protein